MSKTITNATAADNRRKRAATASNVPNQSITAPDSQTPPALPETQSSTTAPRLCEPVVISAELFHRVEEYAELHGLTVEARGNPCAD